MMEVKVIYGLKKKVDSKSKYKEIYLEKIIKLPQKYYWKYN